MWTEYPTCHVATFEQRSPEWFKLRTGALTGSIAAEWGGENQTDLKQLAQRICGLISIPINDAMRNGTMAEPIIRDWYSSYVKTSINEVGMGIWKENPIFRASPDGLMTIDGRDLVVEIKAPKKLYHQLISHAEATEKGYTPSGTSHIFRSHYAQMTATCAVFGRKACDYVVVSLESGRAYCERISFDEDYWNRLRNHGELFYDNFVKPCLEEHGLERTDPV